MEALTGAKKKELHMLGILDGLRRFRDGRLPNLDISKSDQETVRKAIDLEISKIMSLPEYSF